MDYNQITTVKKTEGRRLISYITIVSVLIFFIITGILLLSTYMVTMENLKQERLHFLEKTMDVIERVLKDDVNEIGYISNGILSDRNLSKAIELKKRDLIENELADVKKTEIGDLIDFLVVTHADYSESASINGSGNVLQVIGKYGPSSGKWRIVNDGTLSAPEVFLIKKDSVLNQVTGDLVGYVWVGINLNTNRKLVEEIINQSEVSDLAFFYGNKMLISYNTSGSSGYINNNTESRFLNPISNLHTFSKTTEIFDSGGNLTIKFAVTSDRADKIRKTYITLALVLFTVLTGAILILVLFIRSVISVPLKNLIEFTEMDSEKQLAFSGPQLGKVREFNEIGIAMGKMIDKINENQEAIERAQSIAKLGTWQLDIESGKFKCSKQLHLILEKDYDCAASFDLFIQMLSMDGSKTVKDALDETLKYGIEKSLDHRIRLLDKIIWVHHIIKVIRDNFDKPVKIVGTVQDITERKRILDELAQYRDNLEVKVSERTRELSEINSLLKAEIKERKAIEEDLRKAKKAADEASITKNRFLANMSHEIRTPMNSIIGYLDLSIQDPRIDPEIKENLIIASNSAGALLRIFNDILDISKMEEGKLQLVMNKFSLNRMMKKILSSFRMEVLKKGLSLKLVNNPVLSKCYFGDEIRITQVLINIIGNAVKFTDKGEITVRVEAVGKERIHFEIEDTGIGISKDNIEKIMEPFSQEDISSSRKFGGVGLGTSISKQLVQMMGGELHLESSPNEGSKFSFVIELKEAECSENCNSQCRFRVDEDEGSLLLRNSYKILLAEDVAANAKLAEIRLIKYGHSVKHVWNGKEVLEIVWKEDFDLVLMDVQMPVMDGFSAVREMRNHEKRNNLKRIPVIALTANIMKEDVKECLDAGMDAVVGKPVDFSFLAEEIENILTGNTNHITDFSIISDNENQKNRIKGINIKKGLKLWKDEKLYFDSLEEFFRGNRDSVKELRKLILRDDLVEAAKLAHKLTGITGNLAIDDLYGICRKIQEKIRVDDKKSLTGLIDDLIKSFDLAGSEMISLSTEENYKTENNGNVIEEKNLRAVMNILVDALHQNELVVAEMIIETLSESFGPDVFEKVKEALKHFDFLKALDATYIAAEKLNIKLGGVL